VFDDVAFGPRNLGLAESDVRARVAEALDAVGLPNAGERTSFHLSVGQKKRVALASVLAMGCEVLVLDEPTSALDPVAEWNVFEHIRELAEGRAVVLISHRFSTVRSADRIHILDEGRIVESGTHEELIALGGRYARMYEVQARAYTAER
jgi:ATP-binding cassette, subfamily B, bacterial